MGRYWILRAQGLIYGLWSLAEPQASCVSALLMRPVQSHTRNRPLDAIG